MAPLTPEQRKLAEQIVWTKTHRDYRGFENGTRYVLLFVPTVGTCSVPLSSLTDEQIFGKLPRVTVETFKATGKMVRPPKKPKA